MARFEYPYKKSINVTAWVLQFIVCIASMGFSAWLLWFMDRDSQREYSRVSRKALLGAAAFTLVVVVFNILFNMIEICLIAGSRMHPGLYLSSACIKTLVWGVVFLVNVVTLAPISIILSFVMFATSMMQLIYGAVLIHRKRKGTLLRGIYVPTDHVVGLPENPVYGGSEPQERYFRPSTAASSEYKSPLASPGLPSPKYAFGPQSFPSPGAYELDSRSARNF